MKLYYDQHKTDVPFKEGDLVLLKGADLRIKNRTPKLAAKNYGPYKIEKKLGPVTFQLKLPRTHRVHPVFHASKLIPYHKDEIADRNPPEPPPIEVEGHDEWEVEKILDSKVDRGWVKYYVKWAGYDDSHNSWHSVRDVRNAKDLIRDFHIQHPDAPEPISLYNARPVSQLYNREITDDTPQPDFSDHLFVKRLLPEAILPRRAHEDDAGYDLFAAEGAIILPWKRVPVNTGISISIPNGTYARIAPRSGLAVKHNIDIGAGVVDRSYRGPLLVVLINNGTQDFTVNPGDRIAQLILEKISNPSVEEVEALNDTSRGTSGFGSTGIQLLAFDGAQP